MKKISIILSLIFVLTLSLSLTACGKEEKFSYGEKEMTSPFWENNKMYNESVLMVKEHNEGNGNGYLAFTPVNDNIRISSYDMETVYEQGKDYTVKGREIIRTENSAMPVLEERQLFGENLPADSGTSLQDASDYTKKELGYQHVTYTEGMFLVKNQVLVTYEYDSKEYTGEIPLYQGDKLKNFKAKLDNKENVDIVIYGDSIATGCNATGSGLVSIYDEPSSIYTPLNIPPMTPSWAEMMAKAIENANDVKVNLLSAARGGMTSDWGKLNAKSRPVNVDYGYTPDLVILHFGLNDSTFFMEKEHFKENYKSIINDIREMSAKPVDFVLVGSMNCSPYAVQIGGNVNYFDVLTELATEFEDVVAVDAGKIHKYLTEKKRFADMIANNISHPNDFLVRVYGMILNATLVK